QTLDKIRASAVALEQRLQVPATGAVSGAAVDAAHRTLTDFLRHNQVKPETIAALAAVNGFVSHDLQGVNDFNAVPAAQRRALRLNIYLVSETLGRLIKAKKLPAQLGAAAADDYQKTLKSVTNFIPTWVKIAVALALGFGTMIGWKRIVVTVGEKIGKAHLTYAQGASAEIVAFGTIE